MPWGWAEAWCGIGEALLGGTAWQGAAARTHTARTPGTASDAAPSGRVRTAASRVEGSYSGVCLPRILPGHILSFVNVAVGIESKM